MTELEVAWINAVSFTEKKRPTEAKYIGMICKTYVKGIREYLFYKDIKNTYWYESRWKQAKV